ncbi:hypothetical protein O6H91_13G072300 [Diphasiastrum complanatum]|uniref:Uncharacterized protein n=1 Tax=Diphasiastrum complanatum TaxID=34168 RepID=A0ACC2BW48_DIPCM|nr:hypothetical protein O6H91_13G072300 [Diphasiastrum complanatum]
MMSIIKEGPEWLTPFLSAQYFSHCASHAQGRRENTRFCIDCQQGPLCATAIESKHVAHNTLQIRKASRMNVVKLNEVKKYIDVSNIQVYTINGATIIFLHARPHLQLARACSSYCEVCGRNIVDPVRFCSIGCKVECAKQNKDDTCLSLSELYAATPDLVHGKGGHRSSAKNECHKPPTLGVSEQISSNDPIGKPMKEKLKAEQWSMQHLELRLQKSRSQNISHGSARGRENMDHQNTPLPPGPCSTSQASVQDLDGSILHTLSEMGNIRSPRVHRRKGIPHRSPMF